MLLCVTAGPHEPSAETADQVLRNGKVYTVDSAISPGRKRSPSKDGALVAVGSNQEMEPLIEDGTRVVDLGGRMVLPGLIDVHLHALEAGTNESLVLLPDRAHPRRL